MPNRDLLLKIRLSVPNEEFKQVESLIDRNLSKASNIDLRFNHQRIRGQIAEINTSLKEGSRSAKNFGDQLALSAKRTQAYAIAAGVIYGVSNAFVEATDNAIRFGRETGKIAQTVNREIRDIDTDKILDISKRFGLSNTKVAETVRILAQAGLSFKDALRGAELLSRTTLLASFDELKDTTEGLIVLMEGFDLSVEGAAQGLEVINAVSKRYAVEANDLVSALKRTGGVFATTGGNVEELVALITKVRSTTRESADTISTGFRTIFSRLQRPKTIQFFKDLNIELEDARGNFVGNFEAIRRISEGLEKAAITPGSVKFAEVIEEIGGLRQVSRVIPLITDFARTQEIFDVANSASAESAKDAAIAQETLAFRIDRLRQKFLALFVEISESQSFKLFTETILRTADALLTLADRLQVLLPLLIAVGAIKSFQIARNVVKRIDFSQITAANSGGIIPGQGNKDTVPALLTPGEFVINKKSAEAYGYDKLAKINRYAKGGRVRRLHDSDDPIDTGGRRIPGETTQDFQRRSKQLEKIEKQNQLEQLEASEVEKRLAEERAKKQAAEQARALERQILPGETEQQHEARVRSIDEIRKETSGAEQLSQRLKSPPRRGKSKPENPVTFAKGIISGINERLRKAKEDLVVDPKAIESVVALQEKLRLAANEAQQLGEGIDFISDEIDDLDRTFKSLRATSPRKTKGIVSSKEIQKRLSELRAGKKATPTIVDQPPTIEDQQVQKYIQGLSRGVETQTPVRGKLSTPNQTKPYVRKDGTIGTLPTVEPPEFKEAPKPVSSQAIQARLAELRAGKSSPLPPDYFQRKGYELRSPDAEFFGPPKPSTINPPVLPPTIYRLGSVGEDISKRVSGYKLREVGEDISRDPAARAFVDRQLQGPVSPSPSGEGYNLAQPKASRKIAKSVSNLTQFANIDFTSLLFGLSFGGQALSEFTKNADGSSTTLSRVIDTLLDFSTTIAGVGLALNAFGVSLKTNTIVDFLNRGLTGGQGFGALIKSITGGGRSLLGGPSRFLPRFSGIGLAGAAGVGALAYGAGSLIDAGLGTRDRRDRAIQQGNIAEAGQLALEATIQDDITKLSAGLAALSAGIAATIPILGPFAGAIGLATAATIKLTDVFGGGEQIREVIKELRNFGAELGLLDSQELIESNARLAASMQKAEKNIEQSTADLQKQLKAIRAGTSDQTLEELAGGSSIREMAVNLERAAIETIQNRKEQQKQQQQIANPQFPFDEAFATALAASGFSALPLFINKLVDRDTYAFYGAADGRQKRVEDIQKGIEDRREAGKNLARDNLDALRDVFTLQAEQFVRGGQGDFKKFIKSLSPEQRSIIQSAEKLGVAATKELEDIFKTAAVERAATGFREAIEKAAEAAINFYNATIDLKLGNIARQGEITRLSPTFGVSDLQAEQAQISGVLNQDPFAQARLRSRLVEQKQLLNKSVRSSEEETRLTTLAGLIKEDEAIIKNNIQVRKALIESIKQEIEIESKRSQAISSSLEEYATGDRASRRQFERVAKIAQLLESGASVNQLTTRQRSLVPQARDLLTNATGIRVTRELQQFGAERLLNRIGARGDEFSRGVQEVAATGQTRQRQAAIERFAQENQLIDRDEGALNEILQAAFVQTAEQVKEIAKQLGVDNEFVKSLNTFNQIAAQPLQIAFPTDFTMTVTNANELLTGLANQVKDEVAKQIQQFKFGAQ